MRRVLSAGSGPAIWMSALLVLCGALLLAACGGPSFRGKIQNPVKAAPDIALTDQRGQPFRLSDQKGNVVLLYFGYTYCPDVCPTTLGDFKRIASDLGDLVGRVKFVFVTADPDRDTPERLMKYLAIFNPDFIGLVGTKDELKVAYEAYDIVAEKIYTENSAANYLVTHTASVFLIDPDGNYRLNYSYGTPAEDFEGDIKTLLAQ